MIYNEFLRDRFDWQIMKIYRDILGKKYNVDGCHGPFVPYVFDDYYSAKTKILIIGQEVYKRINLKEAVKQRLLFDDLTQHSERFKNGKYIKGSPYWDLVHSINREFNRDNPLAFAWTNLIKIDLTIQIFEYEKMFENLVLPMQNLLYSEISALDPDIVIFLTEPKYDKYIEMSFPIGTNLEFKKVIGFDTQDFSSFKIVDYLDSELNRKCFRLNPKKENLSQAFIQTILTEKDDCRIYRYLEEIMTWIKENE